MNVMSFLDGHCEVERAEPPRNAVRLDPATGAPTFSEDAFVSRIRVDDCGRGTLIRAHSDNDSAVRRLCGGKGAAGMRNAHQSGFVAIEADLSVTAKVDCPLAQPW